VFLFPSYGTISALDRQNFEYTRAAGSGAQNALKIGLVERRSWSQKIKKQQDVQSS
jgi:hypothetical protein